MTTAQGGGKVVSLRHRSHLPQEIFLVLIYVTGWVDPRAIVRLEGSGQWKIPMTLSGIKPATSWLVAQHLNHWMHSMYMGGGREYWKEQEVHCNDRNFHTDTKISTLFFNYCYNKRKANYWSEHCLTQGKIQNTANSRFQHLLLTNI